MVGSSFYSSWNLCNNHGNDALHCHLDNEMCSMLFMFYAPSGILILLMEQLPFHVSVVKLKKRSIIMVDSSLDFRR